MPKLTMMKGLPGSGKSTWARAQVLAHTGQTKRVSLDDLRDMLDAGEWSPKNEKAVLKMRDAMTSALLAQGYNVIVDATNLAPKHEPTLRGIAEAHGASFAVQDFTDVSVETCIQRDRERPNPVGEQVIKKMYKQFLFKPAPEVPEPERGVGPRAIIVDIDGTVAKMVTRGPYDYDRVSEDAPKHRVIQAIHDWVTARMVAHPVEPWHIIFCSGRPDMCREDTEAWLKEHVTSPIGVHRYEWTLHMRPTYLPRGRESDELKRDFRNDAVVKKEIYDRHIKHQFDVDFVLDDRNRVVDMWREQGLTCLQVAPGDF